MVRQWRGRWLAGQAIPLTELTAEERLQDLPRAGKPSAITTDQLCQITALACEKPEQSERPISQWSGREIADEIMQRGIVAQISPRHAARLLKRGILNRTRSGTGSRLNPTPSSTRRSQTSMRCIGRPPPWLPKANGRSAAMN